VLSEERRSASEVGGQLAARRAAYGGSGLQRRFDALTTYNATAGTLHA
jgi:hypothetical protein